MGRGFLPLLYVPAQPQSQELRAREPEEWRKSRVGVSHEGVLVINGSGMAPFFSIAP